MPVPVATLFAFFVFLKFCKHSIWFWTSLRASKQVAKVFRILESGFRCNVPSSFHAASGCCLDIQYFSVTNNSRHMVLIPFCRTVWPCVQRTCGSGSGLVCRSSVSLCHQHFFAFPVYNTISESDNLSRKKAVRKETCCRLCRRILLIRDHDVSHSLQPANSFCVFWQHWCISWIVSNNFLTIYTAHWVSLDYVFKFIE